MESPETRPYIPGMRLWWNHVWKSPLYRRASADERREMEIRFCVARALKSARRKREVTQKKLAKRLGIAASTISRVERASNRVTLEVAVRCFIALGCSESEIAEAFNSGANAGIHLLRRRARERCFPYPRPEHVPPPPLDPRFIRKGQAHPTLIRVPSKRERATRR